MERILRFERLSRFFISVILFFPSHSSSNDSNVSRFSISYKASVRQRTHNKKGTNPKKEKTYSYPISPQFKIPQFCQPLQSFYLRYPILHEIDIRQIHQMRNILDMLDLIETQIQTGQVMEIVQALDVRDEIVVEIEVDEVLRDFRWERNS